MSFDSHETHESSQPTQSQPITLGEYLENHDDENFYWNDVDREVDEAWVGPVERAGLHPRKHKVFHHKNKEYLRPPLPFIQHGERLGESGSTLVYRVTSPVNEGHPHPYRRTLALKVIICNDNSRPPGPDSSVRMKALEEVRTMASIKHHHLVKYVASFEDYCISTHEVKRRQKARAVFKVNQQIKRHILGIAMYPAAQCNLRTLMENIIEQPDDPSSHESWDFLHTYFGCLAQAVACLHRTNVQIRHKDIKPENVVVDDFLLPVLTDFGLSKHFEAGQHSSGPTAKTLKYADPEAIHETRRDERSDVFSLGCVYLEMATTLLGKKPSFAEQELMGEMPSGFKYSECLDRLDGYLLTLSRIADSITDGRRESAQAVKQILPHIRRMMDEDHRKRPFAKDLYPLFRHLYDVTTFAGPCVECENERMASTCSSRARSPVLTRPTIGSGSSGGGGGAIANTPIVRRASTLTGMVVHSSPIDMMDGIDTTSYEHKKCNGNDNRDDDMGNGIC
ncbi:putative Serine/threonine-protein kinase [Podospora fimiseda]|uniref:non-specific serine/threonine protein kinase n=1 Tax=Podospora fimiseda TaxID=252190 RepID=A0AAN7BZJ8_9PEZI|nr:putative Serine/threonine-protein kinase [Podospora fimiseda]